MKVYKFGGASVRSAEGVKNMAGIIRGEQGPIFVIVSAMGKTTNALERVTDSFFAGNDAAAKEALRESESYHMGLVSELFGGEADAAAVSGLFSNLKDIITRQRPCDNDYDFWYDMIVSHGEMLSTTIISQYLNRIGMNSRLLDMRKLFITNARHRNADIDLMRSGPLLKKDVGEADANIYIGQGFIGGTKEGATTTLGREGSDYSAAVAANLLDAESLTIWKDVPGVLNADPKFFDDTEFIPELTYLDAIELAYSGAQIIHPKTIKPLQNKNIPLYVRPFGNPSEAGSVIKAEISAAIDVPVLILKHDQVLLSIRPDDFSFVLEDRFAAIFSLLERRGVRINLIQSSAVNLSICFDRIRDMESLVGDLQSEGYRVVYNDGLELLTIRGYDDRVCRKHNVDQGALLSQKTRKIIRIVRKAAQR